MATLQRFKVLATQCGVVQSPARSPTTSPVVQLRRRKTTLRMLLNLRSPTRREESPIHQPSMVSGFTGSTNRTIAGRTLKDLFVSSPSIEEEQESRKGKTREEVLAAMAARPAWFGLSKRLLRRSWRPMLVTISEQ